MKNILAGKQSMSVFKDTRDLSAKTVEMVDAIIKGTGVIPSYLCEPKGCTIENYKEPLNE